VTVVNKSKQAINELYVAPANDADWGDDRLGDDTLDIGGTIRVRLGRTRECGFDIHIVYEDGSKENSLNTNVCRTHQVLFDGSNAVAPPPGEAHAIVIANQSARPIQMVFISPAQSNDWGDDRLADDSISVGGTKSVTYRGDCVADLRIVFDNRSAEERKGLNLCDTPRISIQPGWTTADTIPTGLTPPPAAQGPAGPAPSSPAPASPPAPAPATPAAADIDVINHSGHDVAEMYIFPPGVTSRGPDRLGANTLKNNAELKVRLVRGDQCKFNLHVVYAGHVKDADLTGLDLCAAPQVTLPP
jgi:hypothetical protein